MSAFMTGCVMPQYSVDIFVWEASSSVPVHFAGGDISTQGIYIDRTSWVVLFWEAALVTLESHHFLLLAVPSEGSVSETSARSETLQLITLQINSDSLEPSQRPSTI